MEPLTILYLIIFIATFFICCAKCCSQNSDPVPILSSKYSHPELLLTLLEEKDKNYQDFLNDLVLFEKRSSIIYRS